MQITSMDEEDAFEVTLLQISDHHSELWQWAWQFTLDGNSSYQSRQDSAPRFIVVFAAQLNALRNSSKLLMAPITLQREK